MGSRKVTEAAGARWRFYRRIRRISSDYGRIVFLLAETLQGFSDANLDLQDFVAGAVFREVGGWLEWLRTLEMTFHMWRRSLMTLILCGRCSIWWCWRVTWLAPRIGKWAFICDADHRWHSFCVAGAVFGEVGQSLYLLHALYMMSFHMWRRSLMTFILRGRCSIWL